MKVVYSENGEGLDSYVVHETFRFDEDVVAIIEEDPIDSLDFDENDSIIEVDDGFTVEPRWSLDDVSNDRDGIASIEEIQSLHRIPSGEPMGGGQTVAVMDSGIDGSHPLFDGVSIERHDMTNSSGQDTVGHGTACAGQIIRLAPDADLISIRIFGDRGSSGMGTILSAYEWLNNNTDRYDIVNMSWGASSNVATINRVHEKLTDKDIQDVVAAGNTGQKGGSPATSPSAYSVGACRLDGQMASFSSYNPQRENPEITAVGKDNRLAQASGTSMGQSLGGPYVKASGTSFSAPEVVGIIAKYGRATNTEFPQKLVSEARDVSNTEGDGGGLVDYRATESALSGSDDPDETDDDRPKVIDSTNATVWAFAGRDSVFIDADWLESGKYRAEKLDSGIVTIREKL